MKKILDLQLTLVLLELLSWHYWFVFFFNSKTSYTRERVGRWAWTDTLDCSNNHRIIGGFSLGPVRARIDYKWHLTQGRFEDWSTTGKWTILSRQSSSDAQQLSSWTNVELWRTPPAGHPPLCYLQVLFGKSAEKTNSNLLGMSPLRQAWVLKTTKW